MQQCGKCSLPSRLRHLPGHSLHHRQPQGRPHLALLPQARLPRRRGAAPTARASSGRAVAAAGLAYEKQYRNFDELLQGVETPVLVDFCTPWCGPCKLQSKVFDNVAPVLEGEVKLVKIDTEKHAEVAARFNIHALPTLILFKKGEAVARHEGLMSEVDLRLWLKARM